MTRLVLLIGFVCMILAVALGLKGCQDGRFSFAADKPAPPADLSSIVILRNGSVLTAPRGTVGRDMMDWLASPHRTERYFELGGKEFDGRAVEPTIEAKVRTKRLIEMLQSSPDVAVAVIGFTSPSGDKAADLRLSRERADWLVQALHEGGIALSRLSAEGRGGADPLGPIDSAAGRARNERVALLMRTKS